MLFFSKLPDCFQILEKSHSQKATEIKVVQYSLDLTQKRVNLEEWRTTTLADIDWFNKHYKDKFGG